MSKLKIPHDAWVLVGDGEKVIILRNEGDEEFPNLVVERLFEHENPPTHEQGTDRPGRYSDAPIGGTEQRSAFEEADWHRLEKTRFAKDIAGQLYKLAHRNRFQKLIIAAPPRTLGDLRDALHAEVKDRVIGEVSKTLTHHPVDQIEKVLTRT